MENLYHISRFRSETTFMVNYGIFTVKEAKSLATKYNGKYENQYYGDGYQLRFKYVDDALKFILSR